MMGFIFGKKMTPTHRPYILAETNWQTVKDTRFQTAILPWGATEAHNYHLPYGTDNYQVKYVGENAAAIAWQKGAKVILLPGIDYGVNTGQLDINLCMNMMPSTQLAILKDICDVLVRHNVEKLVILNGHGANNFVPHIRELALYYPGLFVCVLNWFRSTSMKEIFQEPGDHADEMETSVMMHVAPHLVLPLETAGDGATRSFNLQGFREGWAWAQRPWTMITKDTGSGNPRYATKEKGIRFLEKSIENIGNFLHDLSIHSVEELLH
jgi:creatinine amidohydrolase